MSRLIVVSSCVLFILFITFQKSFGDLLFKFLSFFCNARLCLFMCRLSVRLYAVLCCFKLALLV